MSNLRLRFTKEDIRIINYDDQGSMEIVAIFSEVWRVLRQLRNIDAGEPYSPYICSGKKALGIAKEEDNINFLFLGADDGQCCAKGSVKIKELPRILQFYEAPRYLEYGECSLGGDKVG